MTTEELAAENAELRKRLKEATSLIQGLLVQVLLPGYWREKLEAWVK